MRQYVAAKDGMTDTQWPGWIARESCWVTHQSPKVTYPVMPSKDRWQWQSYRNGEQIRGGQGCRRGLGHKEAGVVMKQAQERSSWWHRRSLCTSNVSHQRPRCDVVLHYCTHWGDWVMVQGSLCLLSFLSLSVPSFFLSLVHNFESFPCSLP